METTSKTTSAALLEGRPYSKVVPKASLTAPGNETPLRSQQGLAFTVTWKLCPELYSVPGCWASLRSLPQVSCTSQVCHGVGTA